MTCLEKLRELYPDWDEEDIEVYADGGCPSNAYIMRDPTWCMKTYDCKKCWDREVPTDEADNVYHCEVHLTGDVMRRIWRLRHRLNKTTAEIIPAALKLYEDGLDVVENARNRPTSMNFEVISNE